MPDPTPHPLWPNGRVIFYEGDNPAKFRELMQTQHGFDPASNRKEFDRYMRASYGGTFEEGPFTEDSGYAFWCPSHLMKDVYDSGRYTLGS